MKWFLIPALLLLMGSMNAQTKLPRMTMLEGFSSTKFQVGENTLSRRDAFAYLGKNKNSTAEAYALFLKGNQQNTASWLWLATACIGGGLMVYGITAADKGIKSAPGLTGAGIFVIGSTAALISSFGATRNYKRAVNSYNRFAGY